MLTCFPGKLHLTLSRSALLLFLALKISMAAAIEMEPVSLASSNWRFEMDRNDNGITERWWERELQGQIKLPGSMTESGLGDEISTSTPWTQAQKRLTELFAAPELQQYFKPGRTKIPFWLTPTRYYVGPAWYQRDFEVPESWTSKSVSLKLERPHWRTDVWVDGRAIGWRDSLSTPHEYDLGLLPPGKHSLTIRVDNRLQEKVGYNAHSVTDHTQTNWNGIVGKLELQPHEAVSINKVRVLPDTKTGEVTAITELLNHTGGPVRGDVSISIVAGSSAKTPFGLTGTTTTIETKLPPTGFETWSEFSPGYRHKLQTKVTIADPSGEVSESGITETPFAFRDFATSGTEFVINGQPAFMRGTLECCIFPLTGYPPMEPEPWRRIMRILKAHGLNHIRFHSWCPPEAAFTAADEAGVYLSVEVASWAHPGKGDSYDRWLYAETQRIIDEYGNHPSFMMLLYGNEPGGNRVHNPFLNDYVDYWNKRESRFLICSSAGWPALSNNEFHVLQEPRIQQWGEGIKSRVNAKPPETVTDYKDFITSWPLPVISHEIGQWCAYPNLDERTKYTGVTRALNFDIFADTLEKHHMADQARDFLMASGKLQTLLYKEDIESALRTKGMGGFQLLDLHDFPGQGTALVGVLDPFWDSKGYVTAEEYRCFAGPVVPLARLSKRVFTNDEALTCSVEFANYGAFGRNVTPQWQLRRSNGDIIGSGNLKTRNFPRGNGILFGEITQPLDKVTQPEKLVLEVSLSLPESEQLWAVDDVKNQWDVWVYPKDVSPEVPADILLTRNLDAPAMDKLKSGGKVVLVPEPSAVLNDPKKPIIPGFSSIFWNTAWTGGQAPHTLGILCDPGHPALEKFPTDFHSNWQWWYLLHNTPVMILDAFEPQMRPIVQMIDDWTTNRKLGYVFEANYGGGKLMVCTLPIADDTINNPVSKQMRRSLLDYAASDKFSPKENLTKEQLERILKLD